VAVELATGYINIIPSARGLGAAITRDINPERLGQKLGADIGHKLTTGVTDAVDTSATNIEDRLKRINVDSLSKTGGKLETLMGTLGKVALGIGGIAAGVVVVGKQFFDAASDMNESVSKVGVVFGAQAPAIVAFADTAAKSLGISKQAALEAAGTFGNLFRAMGLGAGESADMSTHMIQLASDLASFNNAKPEDVLEALKSGLVGETEPLRQFGVNLNEARIQAEALRLGLVHGNVNMADVETATVDVEKANAQQAAALKKSGAGSLEYRDAQAAVAQAEQVLADKLKGSNVQLDAGQKAQAAYSLIMADTTLAQGDFARTADGVANSTRTAGAQWEDLKAKLGEKLLPIGAFVITLLTMALDNLNHWWDEHGPAVVDWFKQVGDKFHDIFGPDPVANFVAGAGVVQATLKEVQDKFHETFGEDSGANLRTGSSVLNHGWWQDLTDDIGKVPEALGNAWIQVEDELIDPFFGTMQDFQKNVLDPIWGSLQVGIPGVLENIGAIFSGIKDHVIDPLIGIIQTIVDKINGFLDNDIVKSVIHSSILGLNPLAGHAEGGVIGGPIGAPRLVVAHGGETVLPTHQRRFAALRNVSAESIVSGAAMRSSAPMAGGLTTGDIHLYGMQEAETAFTLRSELRKLSYFVMGT
jgi:hypothetical protein